MSAGGFFTYAGRSSRDFGILVDAVEGIWNSPERDYESVEIPGRSGELTIDNGRWKNVQGSYKCGVGVRFQSNYESFRAFISAQIGYKRLEDSWHPDEYRKARVSGSLSPELIRNGVAGEFELKLDAMPQRYLKSGEVSRSLSTGSNTLQNPTLYAAAPLMAVSGSGTLQIGGKSVQVLSHSGVMVIDFETGDAYASTGHVNYNQYLKFLSGVPELAPGTNYITIPSGMTASITPRWWTL